MTAAEAGERELPRRAAAASGHVAILMGTCNGARFLAAQLDSIAAQSHRDWRLVVSDDGSTDATRAILADFGAGQGNRVTVRPGPCRGFAPNFLGLAGDPGIVADTRGDERQ